jgi:hypothetical protein
MPHLAYSVRYCEVPMNLSLLAITICPSVIKTLVYNDKNIHSVSWRCNRVRPHIIQIAKRVLQSLIPGVLSGHSIGRHVFIPQTSLQGTLKRSFKAIGMMHPLLIPFCLRNSLEKYLPVPILPTYIQPNAIRGSARLSLNILPDFLLSQQLDMTKCIEQLIQSDRRFPAHLSKAG